MTARCLIVDDESPARDELRYLLRDFDDVEVVGEATTAEEALVLIRSVDYDVVFVDIRMPGMGGLAMTRLLAEQDPTPAVVFVTAFADHAVEAFDLEAVDYLVKPFDEVRLRRALDRALERPADRSRSRSVDDEDADVAGSEQAPNGERGGGERPPATAAAAGAAGAAGAAAGATPSPARIPVHRGDRIVLIEESRVVFAEAARGYAYLKLPDDRVLVSFTLSDLEKRLSPVFVRTHRSFLVNTRYVREVVPDVGGSLMLIMADREHSRVPVARRQAPEVRRHLGM